MQIEAVYDHGLLRFKSPIALRQSHFEFKVDIPAQLIMNEEKSHPLPNFDGLDLSMEVLEQVKRLKAIQQNILAEISEISTTASDAYSSDERARWDAFDLRRQERSAQGRAI